MTHTGQRQCSHNTTIGEAVEDYGPRKDTILHIMRRPQHRIRGCFFQAQSKSRRSTRQHVDPENGDGAEREHGALLDILECQPEDQNDDFGDVHSEQVDDEPLDVRKETSSLADGHTDGVEITMREVSREPEDDISITYSSVKTKSAASFATSEPAMPIAIPTGANFKAGESLTPSPDIERCFPRRLPAWIMRTLVSGEQRAMTKGNSGRASISRSVSLSNSVACDTTRVSKWKQQTRKGSHSHHSSLGGIRSNDLNGLSDSPRSCDVVTSEHVNDDTSPLAGTDGTDSLGTGWVGDTCQSEEDKVALGILTSDPLDSRRRDSLGRQTDDTKTLRSKLLVLVENEGTILFLEGSMGGGVGLGVGNVGDRCVKYTLGLVGLVSLQ